MKHIVAVISLTILLCLAVACNKAPNGVIPESTMEDMLVDLQLADAYIESHWDQFPDDSSKLVLKQSIFAKYGVTPELYDTSLVWYARNMDVYVKVYDNVIARLQDMRASDNDNSSPSQPVQTPTRHTYAAQGDSADLWHGMRRWTLTQGMRIGYITFDIEPDKEFFPGDRYEFQFSLKPVRSTFRTFIAVDYKDGGTTYVHRYTCNDGWNNILLQSDSTREVSRVYGYLYYNIVQGDIAYVDSLTLLRTHLDRNTYSAASNHKTIERVKRDLPEVAKPGDPVPPQQTSVPVVKPKDRPVVHQQGQPTTGATKQPDGTYKPKEGVNKSSANRHVTQSPNASHLPRTPKQRD